MKTATLNARDLAHLTHALRSMKLKITVQAVVLIHTADAYEQELARQICGELGIKVNFATQPQLFSKGEIKQ